MAKQHKSAHFRRPYQKPRIDRSQPTNSALEFAIAFDMLMDEEIEDVRKGRAEISNSYLVYKFGQTFGPPKIYLFKERRLKILADRLLGLDEEPKT